MLEDQPGGDQPAPRLEEAAEQRGRHVEGRVRDDVIRTTWEPELGRVRLYDHDAAAESLTQALRAIGMRFDRDDTRARVEERARDRAGAGADVEDGGTGRESCVSDEPLRPPSVELVPAPAML